MKKRMRIAVLLTAATVAAALLLAFLALSALAGHDCTGEGCAVCAILSKMSSLLRAALLSAALCAIFAALVGCRALIARRLFSERLMTLVILRVKLTN